MALFYLFFFQNHSYYLVQIDFLKTQIKNLFFIFYFLQIFKDNSESNKKVRDIVKMEHTFAPPPPLSHKLALAVLKKRLWGKEESRGEHFKSRYKHNI